MKNRWSSSGKFQGFTTFGLLEQIQEYMKERQCDPEQFNDRTIFMVNVQRHFFWGEKENAEKCRSNSHEVANYARRFLRGYWSFLGLGSEKKRYGTNSDKLDGVWDKNAEEMTEFSEISHPIFRASSALERGELQRKGGRKKTIHVNGSEQNVELILCNVMSASQLSICGAGADLWREVSKDTMASRKLEAHDPLETMEIPAADPRTDEQRQWNLIQALLWRWFENCRKRTIITSHLMQKDQAELYSCAENVRCFVTIRELELIRKLALCWALIFVIMEIVTVLKFRSDLCFKTTASWVRIVNEVEKYVTETTETTEDKDHRALEKLVAKATPRLKLAVALTPIAVSLCERKWVDVNPGSCDHECWVTTKAMIRFATTWSE